MSGASDRAITNSRVRAQLAVAEAALRQVEKLLTNSDVDLSLRGMRPQLHAAAAVITTARITSMSTAAPCAEKERGVTAAPLVHRGELL